MSFAQRLAHNSGTSRQQIIQHWVRQQVGNFETECGKVSDRGGYVARYDCRVNSMPCLGHHREIEPFRLALLQALQNHGFRSLSVEQVTRLSCQVLHVAASWDQLDEAEGCQGPAGGIVASCGICHEDRPLVALAPCGHVLCSGCQQLLRDKPCPFCRQPVQAVTRGIFVD
ncbi:SSM4 [Symbiodinium sp. CCMP2592]|nr:SSM4 [Symbiodinium sp. CCMP2592]